SVPLPPPIGALPEGVTMTALMEANAGPDREYYRLFFAEPGVAEADFEADIDQSMRGLLCSISGAGRQEWDGHWPKGETMTQQFEIPDELPPWLSEADLAFFVAEMTRTGFRGGFNWYRNIDALPAILAPWVGQTVRQPVLYMAGTSDLLAGNTPDNLDIVRGLPDLRHFELVDDVGHWIQQEAPERVNDALVSFLHGLD
ncbi:MAG: alpha/beta hydrolase, partial [Actinomycetota bacterium]